MYDNEEAEDLDEFKGKGKGKDIGYVPLPFVTLSQKESNCLTDIDKEIRSPNHFV